MGRSSQSPRPTRESVHIPVHPQCGPSAQRPTKWTLCSSWRQADGHGAPFLSLRRMGQRTTAPPLSRPHGALAFRVIRPSPPRGAAWRQGRATRKPTWHGACIMLQYSCSNGPDPPSSPQPRRRFDHEGRPIWLRDDGERSLFQIGTKRPARASRSKPSQPGRRLENLKPGAQSPQGAAAFSTMKTRTHAKSPSSRLLRAQEASKGAFRQPSYDCRELPDAVAIVVYVPGVGASGVEIEAHGPDLLVTAHKTRFVRVNWQALHLEGSQRDYACACGLAWASTTPRPWPTFTTACSRSRCPSAPPTRCRATAWSEWHRPGPAVPGRPSALTRRAAGPRRRGVGYDGI